MGVYSPLTTSLDLDGVDGFPGEAINWGNLAEVSYERTVNFTAAIWVKVNGGGNDRIMGKAGGSAGWRLHYAPVETGSVAWLNRSSLQTLEIRSIVSGGAPNVNDGNWHLIVGVQRGAGTLTHADIDLYVDGVQMTAGDGTLSEIGDDITSTTVGAANMIVGETSGGGQSCQMTCCHSATWTFAMTAAQVVELYGNGQPQVLRDGVGGTKDVSFADPNFWFALGNGDTTGAGNVIDLSANSNDGTAEADVEAADFTGGDFPPVVLFDFTDLPELGLSIGTEDVSSFPGPTETDTLAPMLALQGTEDYGIGGAGGDIEFFKMRGRDQTCPAGQQPAYVYWTVQDAPDTTAAQAQVSDLICGLDPLTDVVDIEVAMKWKEST